MVTFRAAIGLGPRLTPYVTPQVTPEVTPQVRQILSPGFRNRLFWGQLEGPHNS